MELVADRENSLKDRMCVGLDCHVQVQALPSFEK